MMEELKKCLHTSQHGLHILFWMNIREGWGPSVLKNGMATIGNKPNKNTKKQDVAVGKYA